MDSSPSGPSGDSITSTMECGPPAPVSKRVRWPSCDAFRKPIVFVSRLIVPAASATVSVTEWNPRMACSSSTGDSFHGFQVASLAWPTSSSSIPSASARTIASVSNLVTLRWSTPSFFIRLLQKSSARAGTWNATVVTWLLPARCFGHVGQPKNVITVPGVPT